MQQKKKKEGSSDKSWASCFLAMVFVNILHAFLIKWPTNQKNASSLCWILSNITGIECREKFQQSDLSESLSCFHGNLLYPTWQCKHLWKRNYSGDWLHTNSQSHRNGGTCSLLHNKTKEISFLIIYYDHAHQRFQNINHIWFT